VTHLPRSQTYTSSQTVYFVFFFETVQTFLTGVDIWHWSMAELGDLKSHLHVWFSLIDIAAMGGIMSLIVQLFFCYRIYTLNKRLWWLCTIIFIVSLIPSTFCEYSFIVPIQKLSFAAGALALWFAITVSIARLLFVI
jgi:hypothetical protein